MILESKAFYPHLFLRGLTFLRCRSKVTLFRYHFTRNFNSGDDVILCGWDIMSGSVVELVTVLQIGLPV